MTKNNYIFWRLLPITILGLYNIYKLVKDADTVDIFGGIFSLGLNFVFVCVFIYNIFIDGKVFRATKSKASFLPTIIGTLIVVVYGVTQVTLDNRDNAKLILQANNDGGFNGCGFEFRADGTYKFFNGSGLGVDYSRGNYTIKDSIIILDKSNIDNVIKSKTLIIRPFHGNDSTRNQIIYQINDKHEVVDKNFGFIVNEDNRKK